MATNKPITKADYDDPNPSPRVLLSLQLSEAFDRYMTVDSKTPALLKIAIADVVQEICRMDASRWPEDKNDKRYESKRDADPDGKVMNGLRYVRNAHEHDFIVIANAPATVGVGWTNGKPTILAICQWRDLTDDEKSEKLDARRTVQRNVYAAELTGGRSVRESLVRALRFFRSEGLLEVEFGKKLDRIPRPINR